MNTQIQTVVFDNVSLQGFEPKVAAMFAEEISKDSCINGVVRIKVELHGSFASQSLKDLIAATIVTGLQGLSLENAQVNLQQVRNSKRLRLSGLREIYFDVAQDLLIQQQELPTQSSGITISAKNIDAEVVMQRAYWLAS
ncbi:MAG TPA: hypothetical protein DE179_12850 [Oceanospirillaceae bacterium]|nr:hypothetical protein [Oceanospirillaceae bacterium]